MYAIRSLHAFFRERTAYPARGCTLLSRQWEGVTARTWTIMALGGALTIADVVIVLSARRREPEPEPAE